MTHLFFTVYPPPHGNILRTMLEIVRIVDDLDYLCQSTFYAFQTSTLRKGKYSFQQGSICDPNIRIGRSIIYCSEAPSICLLISEMELNDEVYIFVYRMSAQ